MTLGGSAAQLYGSYDHDDPSWLTCTGEPVEGRCTRPVFALAVEFPGVKVGVAGGVALASVMPFSESDGASAARSLAGEGCDATLYGDGGYIGSGRQK